MEAALLQFAAKADMLKNAIVLRDASISKPTHHEALVGMSDEIDDLEDAVAQIKEYLEQEEAQLVPAQNMLALLTHQQKQIDHVQKNIPSQMSPPVEAHGAMDTKKGVHHESTAQIVDRSEGKPARGVKKPKIPQAEKVAYVKVDEFNNTPKYIRGRVGRDQVNKIVDVIYEVTNAKQKVLATPRRKLSDADLTRWTNFQEAENTETKGTIFFTEADVKDLTPHRIDGAGRTCLAILRHLGRVREVRGGGLTRIVVLPCHP